MAVKIRMKRMGRRKRPFYRLVAIDSRTRRDGKEIERLGWYDPIPHALSCEVKEERIIHWLKEGAQPSDTVQNLFKKTGLALKWHLIQKGKSEKEIEKEMTDWIARKEAKQQAIDEKKAKAPAKAEEPAEDSAQDAETVEATPEETPVEEVSVEPETEEKVEAAPEETTEASEPVAEETPVEEPAEEASDEEGK